MPRGPHRKTHFLEACCFTRNQMIKYSTGIHCIQSLGLLGSRVCRVFYSFQGTELAQHASSSGAISAGKELEAAQRADYRRCPGKKKTLGGRASPARTRMGGRELQSGVLLFVLLPLLSKAIGVAVIEQSLAAVTHVSFCISSLSFRIAKIQLQGPWFLACQQVVVFIGKLKLHRKRTIDCFQHR